MGRASTRRKARPRAERAPTIAFSFKADRFGFSSTALSNGTVFATNLVEVVDRWAAAIEALFGDVETALRLAGEARILPAYPAWSAVRKFRQSIQTQLKARPGGKSIDASVRYSVEELRLYLADLCEWAGAFQIGVWAATIAGLGSAEPDARARRLQGLRTLPAVYEIDKAAAADKVLGRLKQLRAAGSLPTALLDVVRKSEDLTVPPGYLGEFVEAASEAEPSRIYDWLTRLTQDAKRLADGLSSIRSPALLREIEKAYWRQWRWLSDTVTRDPAIAEVTILDLIHTARHGNISVVPTRGGRLSVGQWSRILNLGLRPGDPVPKDVIDAALHTLRLPIRGYTPSDVEQQREPIAAIRPRSAQSAAWSWAPQEGVCALALMPDDVANADRGDTSPLPGAPEDPVVAELARARSVDVLEFVELGGDMTLEAARSRAPLRTASERIFFGSTPLYYGPGYYIDRPDHARDLYESTRQAYGHLLFPVPPPPERPFYQYVLMPWLPFWDVLRFLSRWIPRQVRNAVRLVKAGRTQLLPQILGRFSQIGAQLSRMRPRR